MRMFTSAFPDSGREVGGGLKCPMPISDSVCAWSSTGFFGKREVVKVINLP